MTEKPNRNEKNRGAWLITGWRSWCVVVLAPMLLFVAIVMFAPNFVTGGPGSTTIRQDPLGGDFLQEYAGGVLFRDKQQNNQLYNVDVCREIQHDADLLGFEWNDSRFFPMVYPPFYYAAVSPISRLDYAVAMRVWLFGMVFCLVLSMVLLKRSIKPRMFLLLLPCVATPLLLSLTTGQKSTLLLLILVGTFCLLRGGKPFLAGAIFGLIAFKPHLGIPIGLCMMAQRNWSFVNGCYITVGCLIVASISTGFEICTDFFGVTMGFTNYVHNDGYHLEQGFSLWSAWQLALGDSNLAKWFTAVSSVVVLAVTAWLLRKKGSMAGQNLFLSMSMMVIATVLVAPHLYAYDLTMLVLPAILLAHVALTQDNGPDDLRIMIPLVALALLLVLTSPLIWLAEWTAANLGVVCMVVAWVGIALKLRDKPLVADVDLRNSVAVTG